MTALRLTDPPADVLAALDAGQIRRLLAVMAIREVEAYTAGTAIVQSPSSRSTREQELDAEVLVAGFVLVDPDDLPLCDDDESVVHGPSAIRVVSAPSPSADERREIERERVSGMRALVLAFGCVLAAGIGVAWPLGHYLTTGSP